MDEEYYIAYAAPLYFFICWSPLLSFVGRFQAAR